MNTEIVATIHQHAYNLFSNSTHPLKTCFEKMGIGAIDPERRDGIAIESSRGSIHPKIDLIPPGLRAGRSD